MFLSWEQKLDPGELWADLLWIFRGLGYMGPLGNGFLCVFLFVISLGQIIYYLVTHWSDVSVLDKSTIITLLVGTFIVLLIAPLVLWLKGSMGDNSQKIYQNKENWIKNITQFYNSYSWVIVPILLLVVLGFIIYHIIQYFKNTLTRAKSLEMISIFLQTGIYSIITFFCGYFLLYKMGLFNMATDRKYSESIAYTSNIEAGVLMVFAIFYFINMTLFMPQSWSNLKYSPLPEKYTSIGYTFLLIYCVTAFIVRNYVRKLNDNRIETLVDSTDSQGHNSDRDSDDVDAGAGTGADANVHKADWSQQHVNPPHESTSVLGTVARRERDGDQEYHATDDQSDNDSPDARSTDSDEDEPTDVDKERFLNAVASAVTSDGPKRPAKKGKSDSNELVVSFTESSSDISPANAHAVPSENQTQIYKPLPESPPESQDDEFQLGDGAYSPRSDVTD